MKISIMVPVKNPTETFRKCLDSIFGQEIKNIEVIIIDDSAKKSSLITQYQQKYPQSLIYKKSQTDTVGGSRQEALEIATGDYLVGIDSDCIAQKGWLNALISDIDENHGEVMVTGRNLSPNSSFMEKKVQSTEEFYWQKHVSFDFRKRKYCLFADTKNFAVLTKIAREVGFDRCMIAAEDIDFSIRLRRKGYKIVYSTRAQVMHFHKQRLRQLLKQKIWHGTGYGQMMVKNKSNFELHRELVFLLKYSPALLLLPFYPLKLNNLCYRKFREAYQNFLIRYCFYYGMLKGELRQGGVFYVLAKFFADIFYVRLEIIKV
jgi:GT2 family glycosyltransferase